MQDRILNRIAMPQINKIIKEKFGKDVMKYETIQLNEVRQKNEVIGGWVKKINKIKKSDYKTN